MELRRATGDDALAIETIRVEGWRAAYRHVFPPAELDALPIDERRWRPRLETPPAGWTTLVAEYDRAVVGFASAGPSRDEHGLGLGLGELYALYVDPEHWSSGAGRMLIEAAEARLAAEYAEATLWVLDDNPRACRFYERAGWAPDGATKAEERLGVRALEVRYRKRFQTSPGV
ncbi:MAG TPA: GNAT family N-acetyltransferase [Gaiellaceae bacterium]